MKIRILFLLFSNFLPINNLFFHYCSFVDGLFRVGWNATQFQLLGILNRSNVLLRLARCLHSRDFIRLQLRSFAFARIFLFQSLFVSEASRPSCRCVDRLIDP